MPFIYYDIDEHEAGLNDPSSETPESKFVTNRIKLSERLDSMDPDDKRILVKMIQYDIIKEVLDSIKNLKNTTADTWKNVIGKLNAIVGIDIGEDKSGFDFNAMAKNLIPLVGALAGTLMAFRASQKAESEAAEPQDDPNDTTGEIMTTAVAEKELKKMYDDFINKSIVMKMCEEKTNGFSLNGNE